MNGADAGTETAPVIELEDVHVRYGAFEALAGVSLTVTGGAVGLLGPNGAGKSTLIRTLLGFNRAASGRVRLFGMPMPQRVLEARLQLGYMPEREAVSPSISAVNFVTFLGEVAGMDRSGAMERCHEALNYVGLDDARYRPMETYSTGMLQRVKLAQALIHDPRLLLLDEPTNGLDPDGRVEMLELVRDISRRRNVTVVLCSHLLPDVQHVCDRIVMLKQGRIVQDGSVEALTAPRPGEYEIRVRDNSEAFRLGLEAAGCRCIPQRDGLLHVTAPAEMDASALFGAARRLGAQIRHFAPARNSLAEAFLEAIGSP